jgi:IS30 family transposase
VESTLVNFLDVLKAFDITQLSGEELEALNKVLNILTRRKLGWMTPLDNLAEVKVTT